MGWALSQMTKDVKHFIDLLEFFRGKDSLIRSCPPALLRADLLLEAPSVNPNHDSWLQPLF